MKRSMIALGSIVLLSIAIRSVVAQDGALPVLSTLEGNPVFQVQTEFDWEAGGVYPGALTAFGDQYYLFYGSAASIGGARSISVARSHDGMMWTRFAGNPVFTPNGHERRNSVSTYVVFHNGEEWVMLFTVPHDVEDNDLLLATAPRPEGPWVEIDEPALETDRAPAWDFNFLVPSTVVQTGDDFWLYYYSEDGIGLATSPDGLAWTKYDDPSTTQGEYASSDPVFLPSQGSASWDSFVTARPFVRPTEDGFEMIYTGSEDGGWHEQFRYAISPDGVHWMQTSRNPILDDETVFNMTPLGVVRSDDATMLLYVGTIGDQYTEFVVKAALMDEP